MATTALIATGILCLLIFVLFSALLETLRDVRQIRDALGILDRPLDVDAGAAGGTAPATHGLPQQLDGARSALVLFLSDRCATCRILAASLGESLPAGLWVVIEAVSSEAATAFVEVYGLTSRLKDQRVIIDTRGAIATRMGVSMTPVAYRIENGVIADAKTVPSIRSLSSMIPAYADGETSLAPAKRLASFSVASPELSGGR